MRTLSSIVLVFGLLLAGTRAAQSSVEVLVDAECPGMTDHVNASIGLTDARLVETYCDFGFVVYWTYFYAMDVACAETNVTECNDNPMCETVDDTCVSSETFVDKLLQYTNSNVTIVVTYPIPAWMQFTAVVVVIGSVYVAYLFIHGILHPTTSPVHFRKRRGGVTDIELSPLSP